MANVKKNTWLDTFAWLVHKEAERYIAEHQEEYQTWVQDRAKAINNKTDCSGNSKSKSA